MLLQMFLWMPQRSKYKALKSNETMKYFLLHCRERDDVKIYTVSAQCCSTLYWSNILHTDSQKRNRGQKQAKTQILSIHHCQKFEMNGMSFHHCCCHGWSSDCTSLWIIADKILGSPAVDPLFPLSPRHITSSRNHWGAASLTSTHFPHLLSQSIRSHSLGQQSRPISIHWAAFYTRVPSDIIAV